MKIDDERLKRFVELRKQFRDVYIETGLASLESMNGIHLMLDAFRDTFDDYECEKRGSDYMIYMIYILKAEKFGETFFCLSDEE